MRKQRTLWFIYILCLLSAAILGYQSWDAYRRPAITVEWTTATELDTAGFNLDRWDSVNSQPVRINTALIPASPDPLTGGSYTYEDTDVSPGRTYYYELEEVETDGGTSRFGPIEETAARGGIIELAFAALLAGASLVGLVQGRARVGSGHTQARSDA